jgi:hypothetical protein
MMTRWEFERAHHEEALDIATRICQERRDKAMKEFPHSHVMLRASDIFSEAHLILHEWWRDYRDEHV